MCRFLPVLLLCCSLPHAGVAATGDDEPAGLDARWEHYRSPNFELFSHGGEFESRRLLRNLELLRAIFLERFRGVERRRLEVTVYQFSRTRDFQAYVPETMGKRRLGGFYLPNPDRAVIVMPPQSDERTAQHVVFHEYVHHLFRALEQDPPVWFNEGMAELLAGIRVDGNKLQFGHPVVPRLLALQRERLLSLDTLFATTHRSTLYRTEDHVGLFYAQSWALVHYWYCGESDLKPEAVDQFIRFATHRDTRPAALRPKFEECFGMDYAAMEARLQKYVRSGKYLYRTQELPAIEPPENYERTSVPVDTMRIRLAELAVRTGDSATARAILLGAALEETPDIRALEALGSDAARRGDRDGAVDHWERAIAHGTENHAIFRELALLECRNWFQKFDYDLKLPHEDAERLRARLLRAIEHEPLQSESYEQLAWVEAFAEKPRIAHINLVQEKFSGLQNRARTVIALAMLRVRMGAGDQALALLKQLPAVNPDEETERIAEIIAARVENRAVRLTGGPKAAEEPAETAPPRSGPGFRIPSVPLPADL